VLREVINPFAIGVFAFTFLFLANGMFKLMDWLVIGGVSGGLIGAIILSLVPFMMNVTFPMALLLGCVFAFGRMSESNEIQAMLTCGQTYERIIRPVLILGLVCTLFLLFWCEYVTPRASIIQNTAIFRIIEHMSPIAVLEEGKFSTRLPKRVIYLQKIDLAEHRVYGVAIFDMEGNKIRAAFLSPTGMVKFDPTDLTLTLDLENWEVHMNMETGDPKMVTIDGRIQLVVDCSSMMSKLLRDKQLLLGLSRAQLKSQLEQQSQTPSDNGESKKRIKRVRTELGNRIVIPFSCLALALVGAPLGFWMQRGNRGTCFAAALSVSRQVMTIVAPAGSVPGGSF